MIVDPECTVDNVLSHADNRRRWLPAIGVIHASAGTGDLPLTVPCRNQLINQRSLMLYHDRVLSLKNV